MALSSSSSSSIVIEWSDSGLLVGFQGHGRPQHVFPLQENVSKLSPHQFYSLASPLLSQVWDRLVVAPNSNPRVFIICGDSFVNREALKRALFDFNVSEISFVNGLDTLPCAMGWKRGLIVKVEEDETTVVAHVDGRYLLETFHVVPCGSVSISASGDEAEWWLNENHPLSIIFAVLKSLEASPLDVRSHVASNICVVGGLSSNFGKSLGQRLTLVLGEASSPETTPELHNPMAPELTSVLANIKALQGLVVSITSVSPHRSDVISWVGSSVWASSLNRKHKHTNRIEWITRAGGR